ncbi:hypothetical protein FA13DRAFT_1153707 [Coprinellus micaceus]|uniref:Uncharacterized protein n=1 Tax=Coprinellus micaceus TaxID=71717 RepID=A0A4Y7RBU3_COPMI|nr:hypothetical protein FA13DRAFT_1153707 [Coprinellus micaceus]
MTTRSYSLGFPQVRAHLYDLSSPWNSSTDATPTGEGVLRTTLLPILAQRFRPNALGDVDQGPKEQGDEDVGQVAKQYSIHLQHRANTPSATLNAPPGPESHKGDGWSPRRSGDVIEDATAEGKDDVVQPCPNGQPASDAHSAPIGVDEGNQTTLSISTGTSDSWITLEGSEAEAWDLTPHAIERCESPSRMEANEARPFTYKILPIHGFQCLVKVLASFDKPHPRNSEGNLSPTFTPTPPRTPPTPSGQQSTLQRRLSLPQTHITRAPNLARTSPSPCIA